MSNIETRLRALDMYIGWAAKTCKDTEAGVWETIQGQVRIMLEEFDGKCLCPPSEYVFDADCTPLAADLREIERQTAMSILAKTDERTRLHDPGMDADRHTFKADAGGACKDDHPPPAWADSWTQHRNKRAHKT